jgi:hypothetical protein
MSLKFRFLFNLRKYCLLCSTVGIIRRTVFETTNLRVFRTLKATDYIFPRYQPHNEELIVVRQQLRSVAILIAMPRICVGLRCFSLWEVLLIKGNAPVASKKHTNN